MALSHDDRRVQVSRIVRVAEKTSVIVHDPFIDVRQYVIPNCIIVSYNSDTGMFF